MKVVIFLLMSFSYLTANAVDLKGERLIKIEARKKSQYISSGIFHGQTTKLETKLATIRHSFNKKDQTERVVLDFVTPKIPRIYGHVSSKEKKVYVDLFDTAMEKSLKSLGTSHYVDTINFYPIDSDSLSLELVLKESVNAEVFYLENPGRLVIDLKK